jgi:hypothetical protein
VLNGTEEQRSALESFRSIRESQLKPVEKRPRIHSRFRRSSSLTHVSAADVMKRRRQRLKNTMKVLDRTHVDSHRSLSYSPRAKKRWSMTESAAISQGDCLASANRSEDRRDGDARRCGTPDVCVIRDDRGLRSLCVSKAASHVCRDARLQATLTKEFNSERSLHQGIVTPRETMLKPELEFRSGAAADRVVAHTHRAGRRRQVAVLRRFFSARNRTAESSPIRQD